MLVSFLGFYSQILQLTDLYIILVIAYMNNIGSYPCKDSHLSLFLSFIHKVIHRAK
jgi:TctA family transporter